MVNNQGLTVGDAAAAADARESLRRMLADVLSLDQQLSPEEVAARCVAPNLGANTYPPRSQHFAPRPSRLAHAHNTPSNLMGPVYH